MGPKYRTSGSRWSGTLGKTSAHVPDREGGPRRKHLPLLVVPLRDPCQDAGGYAGSAPSESALEPSLRDDRRSKRAVSHRRRSDTARREGSSEAPLRPHSTTTRCTRLIRSQAESRSADVDPPTW